MDRSSVWITVKEIWKSPYTKTLASGSVPTLILRWADFFQKFPPWVASHLSRFIVTKPDQDIELTPWGVAAADGLLVFLAFGIPAVIFFGERTLRRRESRRAIENAAIDLYAHTKQNPIPIAYSDLEWEIVFHEDYSLSYTHRWTWAPAADTKMIHIRGFHCGSSEPATVIDFSAQVLEGGGKIIVVPAADGDRSKDFLLFPVPPASSKQRVAVSFRWPRSAIKLASVGKTDTEGLRLRDEAVGLINAARITIKFQDKAARYEVRGLFTGAAAKDGTDYCHTKPYEAAAANLNPGQELQVRVTRLS